jgi:hypothetical protein
MHGTETRFYFCFLPIDSGHGTVQSYMPVNLTVPVQEKTNLTVLFEVLNCPASQETANRLGYVKSSPADNSTALHFVATSFWCLDHRGQVFTSNQPFDD